MKRRLAAFACYTLHRWAGLWGEGKFIRIIHFALLDACGVVEVERTCTRCALVWVCAEER
jgi:hypothetical protein